MTENLDANSTQAIADEEEKWEARCDMDRFFKMRKEGQPAYVFDLRGLEDYEAGNLSGSHHLPFEHLETNLHRLPFSGNLLFYDHGDGIAKQAAEVLYENGFSDYYYAEEGYKKLAESLKSSPYDLKMSCVKNDSPEVKHEVITNLLNLEINPRVASHGGVFSLIEIKDDDVYVKLGGGCQGCGMVDVTLRQGVEQRMREVFPDMGELIDVTDHDQGDDPYFQGGK